MVCLIHAVIPQVDAFKWMGVVMIAVAFIGVGGQYFPMWGGMFFPARKGYTEEDYYFAEYSAAERERGLHLASSAFVSHTCPHSPPSPPQSMQMYLCVCVDSFDMSCCAS